MLYPIGYANSKVSLDAMVAKHRPKMHPEYARRLFAMIEASEGLVGIGGGWRSTLTQAAQYARYPGRFAPPGYSFHESHKFTSGITAYQAVDTVGIDGRHSEAWHWVAKHGPSFGLIPFGNVNNEPWHTQCSDIPLSVRAWKAAGRPDPGAWKLPSEANIAPPTTTTPPPKENTVPTLNINLPNLRVGSRGQAVENMQALVNARIEANMAEDGDFGPQTERYLKQAQKALRITVDGLCGPQTWRALLG